MFDLSVAKKKSQALLLGTVYSTFSPPPTLTVSEWADLYRYLSPETSAYPGKWQTGRAEYLRGIMEAISDPYVEEVIIMSSAQVGKTSVIENALGYYIDNDPGPILAIFPKDAKAKEFSQERLAPMLRDTPVLRGKINMDRSRDSSNTIMEKDFPGGHLSMAGANSPANLASRPIRFLFCDEVDRFAESAGSEGDPIDLAKKRTKTFHNRKIVLASTPTIAGMSRIELAFMGSDQRHYKVPCPKCAYPQRLIWSQVIWTDGNPLTAKYECIACKHLWSDIDRRKVIKEGKWEAEEDFKGVAGFHLNELYSPWSRLSEIVENFLDVKHSRSIERMRVWTNTTLGETWEDEGTSLDDTDLVARVEHYPAEVPMPVCILTAAVDVQDDRLEYEVKGWNKDIESWGVEYGILVGDPGQREVWQELDKRIFKRFKHESGLPMKVMSVAVDTGGHNTQAAYTYCKMRAKQGVHAIKGRGGFGIPVVSPPTRNNRQRVALFMIGVDTIKETIVGYLGLENPGPGFCHFPVREGYNEEYFRQLAAEKLVTRYRRGVRKREWKKVRDRNEALDCFVYAYAALWILNPDMEAVEHVFRKQALKSIGTVEEMEEAFEQAEEEEKQEQAKKEDGKEEKVHPYVQMRRNRRQPRSGGWMNS